MLLFLLPGFGEDAKCMLSYRGKKPDLVLPKKSGQFSCDCDCQNFKALGICSHVVALAETCKKLPDLIASFIKAKKTPNMTKFAEATMPKGRGRKGGSYLCYPCVCKLSVNLCNSPTMDNLECWTRLPSTLL